MKMERKEASKDIDEEQSNRVFWVIQTVFGVVIANSLVMYKEVILNPFSKEHLYPAIALFTVYLTVIMSWVDFSFTTLSNPYKFTWRPYLAERLRFFVDLLIVVLYAYLLFALGPLVKDNSVNLWNWVLVYFLLFLLYLGSGLLRRKKHGKSASRIGLIIIFGVVLLGIFAAYICLRLLIIPQSSYCWLNLGVIFAILMVMVSYRIIRQQNIGRSKPWIAIDIDGVLADQITGILPIIQKNYNVSLTYDKITEWNLKIGDTTLDKIIKDKQNQQNYVVQMPIHKGAEDTMKSLYNKYKIAIVTSRDKAIDNWTKQWLKKHRIHYDRLVYTDECKKHQTEQKISVLLDDYTGNIKSFLEKTKGKAILFSRPWNQRREDIKQYFNEGRLAIVEDWKDVSSVIKNLVAPKMP